MGTKECNGSGQPQAEEPRDFVAPDNAVPAERSAAGTGGPAEGKQAPHEQGPGAAKHATRESSQAGDASAPTWPVVAIGSSAGGLEALQEFFGHMPPDSGAAFVVVTHQQAGRTSMLPELLGRATSMPVAEAAEGVTIAPNHVYVAMPDGVLEIAGGTLRRGEVPVDQGRYRPIDHFLRFLALDQGERAVGVILSGAGDDGTLGIREVKAAGGMAMAEDPASARYASMPSSAIATGLVDYVLAPADLPDKLLAYIRGPYLEPTSRAPQSEKIPAEAILRLLVCLRTHTGHDFTGYKKSTMSRRIERRMNVHHIADPAKYLHYLQKNPLEAHLLLRELLISVTRFFRDPEAFEVLGSVALPELIRSREDDHVLRVWLPGCATGEEAYSVAILLHEQIHRAGRPMQVQVFGTDLDDRAIDVARAGVYPEGIVADVSSERLARYFTREDGRFRARKQIRELLVFAVQDVLKDPPFTKLDIIVCRNLLIYLNAEAQKRLLPVFGYALRPGGLLFLGSSETTGGFSETFEVVDPKWKILRRKDTPAGPHPVMMPPVRIGPIAHEGLDGADAPPPTGETPTLVHLRNLLLTRFAPASVVVNGRGDVAYVHGHTGRYLELPQGQPTHNIFEMAREGLAPVLTLALRRAKTGEEAVVHRSVRVQENHGLTEVDVTVAPVDTPEALRGLYLITFEPAAAQPAEPPASARPAADDPGTARERDLAKELRFTRESFQTTTEELETSNEELRSSNEELQSTNEELQSTNEELETSKEEMQSLNEELNSVNAELQAKMDALSQTNDDMRNLLDSTNVASIFLDEGLCVKRYTQEATTVFRLIETDVGRPLTDLVTDLQYEGLAQDCRTVLVTLIPIEREAQGAEGNWHLVRIMPYRTTENVIDGVVITIVDITDIKHAQLEAAAARDLFESIVRTVREPLVVLDDDLRIVTANDAFLQAFPPGPGTAEGRSIYEVGGGQWDTPKLRELLESILPADSAVAGYRFEQESADTRARTYIINARRIERPGGLPGMILLAAEDVTGGQP